MAIPFTDHAYPGVGPPTTGVAEMVTVVPAQTLKPGLAVMDTVGGPVVGLIITMALLLILFEQVVDVLVATTVYVPAAVCNPKLILPPVPATGAPTAPVPIYN